MPQPLSRIEVIEKAARLVRDGALNPALQSYKQLFAQDPTDWAVGNALGDLYLRLGKTHEGISHFMGLGEQLARDGYTAKARAIYRKILRVQPDNELASYRVVELDNQHLVEKGQSSAFMKRMLDTARAAAKQQAEIESSSGHESAAEVPPQPAPAAQETPPLRPSPPPVVAAEQPQDQPAPLPATRPQPAPAAESQPMAAAQPKPPLQEEVSVPSHVDVRAMPVEAPPEPHLPPAPQAPPAPHQPLPVPPAPQTQPPVPEHAAPLPAAVDEEPTLQAPVPQTPVRAAQPAPVVRARAVSASAPQPLPRQDSPEPISFDAGGDDWSAIDLDTAVVTPPPIEEIAEPAQVLAPEEDDEIAAYEALLEETAAEDWNAVEIGDAAAAVSAPAPPQVDIPSPSTAENAVLIETPNDEWDSISLDGTAASMIDLASIASQMESEAVEPLEIVEAVDEIGSEPPIEQVSVMLQPASGTEQPDAGSSEEAIELEELPDDWLSMTYQTAALQLDPGLQEEGEEDNKLPEYRKVERQARRVAARGDFDGAMSALEKFLGRWSHHVPALETLIDIGVDGGFEQLASAQVRLAEACLASGRVAQARNVAIDLVRRYPGDSRCQQVATRIRDLALKRAKPGLGALIPSQVAAPCLKEQAPLDFVHEALGPEAALDFEAPLIDQEDGFEEIRIGLLEDLAAVAEERFAAASRLITARDFARAIGMLEEAVCVPHLRHSAGARLAQAYRESGDCLKALDCLEWAAERPPLNEESGHILAYELALTLEAVGEPQQALGVYQELLAEVGPTFRDVAARAARLRAA